MGAPFWGPFLFLSNQRISVNIPTAFEDKLRRAFDGRLRIRWSAKSREFRIEQKVGRAITAPVRLDEGRDDLICARDGFDYLLTVRSGDRMLCPECEWTELKVPVRDFQDIRCPYCASKGKQGRVVAGFWPLDDTLIEHLQKIDPLRGASKELAAAADRRNEALLASQEREFSNKILAHGSDHYNELVGIPSFGYSTAKCWPAGLGPKQVGA